MDRRESCQTITISDTMNNNIQRQIGNRIRGLRKKLGYTQAELADITNLSHNYIGYLERGKKGASLKTLEIIASALETKVINFFKSPKSQAKSLRKPTKKDQLILKLSNYLQMCDLKDINIIFNITKRLSKKQS